MDAADELRLDGNAAAGVLSDVFAVEMSTVVATCASCGATNVLATATVYARGPGMVLRCPACAAMLVCIVEPPGRDVVVDLSGLARIRM